MIYLRLKGRIGNQIFMYAVARMIQIKKGNKDIIIIEDYKNQASEELKYANSLEFYNLPNVEYVHDDSTRKNIKYLPMWLKWFFVGRIIEGHKDRNEIYKIGMKNQKLYNKLGIFHLQDGFVPYPPKFKRNIYIDGYFQSEKYFLPIKKEIISTFRNEEAIEKSNYPNLDIIKNRNTVCISIKVQHNVGNKMYDVCHMDYYDRAIQYIIERVDNPLFFICSDNVEYVLDNLIDANKYDVVCQDSTYPVEISLGVMAMCKHFIIGNTSFGWWAQYLSKNDDKIVIVPDRWYNDMDEWQYDIYTDNMIRIKV